MSTETFEAALDVSWRLEELARRRHGYHLLLLSGGEATEHPDFLHLAEKAAAHGFAVVLISNGLWLTDPERRAEILAAPSISTIQITNDPRFYPRRVERVEHPKLCYVDKLSVMTPQGRFAGRTHPEVPMRRAPASFNIRSMTRQLGDIREALAMQRARAMAGSAGHCSPSITHEGYIVAGESRECGRIGTVHNTLAELEAGMLALRCDGCGLVAGLEPRLKKAIGMEDV